MKNFLALLILSLIIINCDGQKAEETEDWSRKPEVVTPGKGTLPPSDAIILYAGVKDLSNWTNEKGGEVHWNADEILTVQPKSEGIKTVQSFGSVQLHIEWRSPEIIEGKGQGRGNSGIFLMGNYEVQVLNSFGNVTYADGQAASVYGQKPPLVNASKKPGTWQRYDIIFRQPRQKRWSE